MDAFVARQPIFDRELRVHGYELRYDRSSCAAPPVRDSMTTSRLLATTLNRVGLERLTGGRPAYVTLSRELLVEGFALLLSPDRIVVEVDAGAEVDPDVLAACQRLKDAGYRLALTLLDATPPDVRLVGLADVVKVDCARVERPARRRIAAELAEGSTLFAGRLERAEDYEEAYAVGYELFQGYFFCSPSFRPDTGMGRATSHTFELLDLLGRAELDLARVERLVRADLALCYRLLRYLNSAAFGWRTHIESVGHALVLLGDEGVRRWLWLSALGELSTGAPDELVTISAVRAWMCESLGAASTIDARPLDLFLTGMLSLVDAILGRTMTDLLEEVGVPDAVRSALLDTAGPCGEVLAAVRAAEAARWSEMQQRLASLGLTELVAATCYQDAIASADALLHT